MSAISLNVKDMTCDNCIQHVTDALNAVPGVEGVEVDLEQGKVKVKGNPDSPALVAALDAAGYPPTVAHDGKATCCGGSH